VKGREQNEQRENANLSGQEGGGGREIRVFFRKGKSTSFQNESRDQKLKKVQKVSTIYGGQE